VVGWYISLGLGECGGGVSRKGRGGADGRRGIMYT